MNLDETMTAIEKALKATLDDSPAIMRDIEPTEGWRDLTAHLVMNLARNGLVLIERARFDTMQKDFSELKAAVENEP